MSLVISMLVGSKLSTKTLVKKSISSILENIGTTNFRLVIGVAPYINRKILLMIRRIRQQNHNRIIITQKHCETFAKFTNFVFDKYGITANWFMISHDDIELKTKNFIPIVKKKIKDFKTDIGWISFTDDDYLNRHWAPSTRPGYHYDFLMENAWNNHQMFQFHTLKKDWMNNGQLFNEIDLPSKPVICHAPFSHFVMIETKKLKVIGPCEDWSEVSLLIDEDWGLSAMKKELSNIWIPDIVYTHRRVFGTRAWPIIVKRQKECLKKFMEKWKISLCPATAGHLSNIIREYGNTNIVWSIGKRSYEWEYVE